MIPMAGQPDCGCNANQPLRDRVAAVIDTLRPMLQSDGGDIELVDVDDEGVVSVRLQGACMGCPSASMTLSMGVERQLKDQIPEVKRVVLA
jgi:Fe-S cluster biogenesis protein NfuA